jgi:hypothetical protein
MGSRGPGRTGWRAATNSGDGQRSSSDPGKLPILENFNVFDRYDVREQDRPARKQEFRDKMRNEVCRRLG